MRDGAEVAVRGAGRGRIASWCSWQKPVGELVPREFSDCHAFRISAPA